MAPDHWHALGAIGDPDGVGAGNAGILEVLVAGSEDEHKAPGPVGAYACVADLLDEGIVFFGGWRKLHVDLVSAFNAGSENWILLDPFLDAQSLGIGSTQANTLPKRCGNRIAVSKLRMAPSASSLLCKVLCFLMEECSGRESMLL